MPSADINTDGTVDALDLSLLVSSWGEVPVGDGVVVNVTLSDDGTDQTASLMSQISAAPDGNATDGQTIIMLPTGNYRIDDTIQLSDRNMVTVCGPVGIMDTPGTQAHSPGYVPDPSVNFVGWTDKNGGDLGYDRRHVSMSNCNNCIFQYINFIGPNTERDTRVRRTDYALYKGTVNEVTVVFEHGFAVYAPSIGCKILDCYVKNTYGDALYLGGGGYGGPNNQNIEVSRFGSDYAGRQLVGMVNVEGFYSEDTRFEWGARSGWDLEPNHANDHCWDVEIHRSEVSCQFSAFVLNSPENLNNGFDVNNQPAVQPRFRNISLIDCTQIRVPTSRGPFSHGKGENSEGTLRIQGLRGPIYGGGLYWDNVAIQVSSGWPNIIIEDCDVNSDSDVTDAVISLKTEKQVDTLIIRNNSGGAAPNLLNIDDMYDDLGNLVYATPAPTQYIHCGNTWDSGNQNDGTC